MLHSPVRVLPTPCNRTTPPPRPSVTLAVAASYPSRSRPVLVYQATKAEFMDDVDRDLIADHITAAFERKVHRANPAEV